LFVLVEERPIPNPFPWLPAEVAQLLFESRLEPCFLPKKILEIFDYKVHFKTKFQLTFATLGIFVGFSIFACN
jgi:hypothetical protein